MDIPFLWLVPLLLYLSLDTIVDIFISPKISNRLLSVKVSVFFRTFISPVIFVIIVISALYSGERIFDMIFVSAVILITIIRIFAVRHQYLISCEIEDGIVTVNFLTALMKTKSIQFNQKEIQDVEFGETSWLKGLPGSSRFKDIPGAMNIKYKHDWFGFEVLNRKLKDEVVSKIIPSIMNKAVDQNDDETTGER